MLDGFSFLFYLVSMLIYLIVIYLALPTLCWLQYITEMVNLHMVVCATLKRLLEVLREIEVCHQNIWPFCPSRPDNMIQC
jgi:hypothetical protein